MVRGSPQDGLVKKGGSLVLSIFSCNTYLVYHFFFTYFNTLLDSLYSFSTNFAPFFSGRHGFFTLPVFGSSTTQHGCVAYLVFCASPLIVNIRLGVGVELVGSEGTQHRKNPVPMTHESCPYSIGVRSAFSEIWHQRQLNPRK